MAKIILSLLLSLAFLNDCFAQIDADSSCTKTANIRAFIAGTQDSTIMGSILENGFDLLLEDTSFTLKGFCINYVDPSKKYTTNIYNVCSHGKRLEPNKENHYLPHIGVTKDLIIENIIVTRNGICFKVPSLAYYVIDKTVGDKVKIRPVSDSPRIFHDQEGYIKCITHGDFHASFNKSNLLSLSTLDSQVRYSITSKTFRINSYKERYSIDSGVTLQLFERGPVATFKDTVVKLDSILPLQNAKTKDFQINHKAGNIDFIVSFRNNRINNILFETEGGRVFNINVWNIWVNKEGYHYKITSKDFNDKADLLLDFSSQDETIPFSLLIRNEAIHFNVFLNSKWKRRKFYHLSVSREVWHPNLEPQFSLSRMYSINYNRKGKAKNKKWIMAGDCDQGTGMPNQ